MSSAEHRISLQKLSLEDFNRIRVWAITIHHLFCGSSLMLCVCSHLLCAIKPSALHAFPLIGVLAFKRAVELAFKTWSVSLAHSIPVVTTSQGRQVAERSGVRKNHDDVLRHYHASKRRQSRAPLTAFSTVPLRLLEFPVLTSPIAQPSPSAAPLPPPSPPLVLPPQLLISPPSPPVNNNPPPQTIAPSPTPRASTPQGKNPSPQSTPPTSSNHSFPISTPPSSAQKIPPKATPAPPISSKPQHSIAPSKSTNSSLPSTLSSPPVALTLPQPRRRPVGGGPPATSQLPFPPPLRGVPPQKGSSGISPARGNGNSAVGKKFPGTETSHVSTGLVVVLFVGGVFLLLLLVVLSILLICCRRRRKFDGGSVNYRGSTYMRFEEKKPLEQLNQNIQPHWAPTPSENAGFGHNQLLSSMALPSANPVVITPSSGTFTYKELETATGGFSESNLLGQGGFGYVHRGILPNGKEVAVKQLKMGGQQGEREFQAEVETISQVHHKHLVSLVGYCTVEAERLLVYEFVPNKTLEFHLHGIGQPVMEWGTRMKIAIGSAKGLAYLHEDCNPTIIHRDIKAANILLDFNFEAKVSDFGLAKFFSNTNSSITHITTRVVGTFGYLAPEYASSGQVTDKSDVYSFGVMLLELVTGRPPISTTEFATNGSLVNWARPLLMQAILDGHFDILADPRLQKNYNVNEMGRMVMCAAACVRMSAWRRPRMSQVVRSLEGDGSASDLNNGVGPAHSSMLFPYEDSDFDAHYTGNARKLKIASTSNGNSISRYSETTSEYGLYPSASSTDSLQTDRRG
ncbi:hypothetical protein Nepgr_000896 [Nepenthes gracilis]|uniref:non-specific serine/threonine protein kinase n=1 Tax=Nepenthes gracilis TaxID=150966 RepID=A0AAD3RVR4_NEPGR|nr:hypothetical protein Nepgr_000896 [Nepenthes gracilis]